MLSKALPPHVFAQVMSRVMQAQEAGEDPSDMILQILMRLMTQAEGDDDDDDNNNDNDDNNDNGGDDEGNDVKRYDPNDDDEDDDDDADDDEDHDGAHRRGRRGASSSQTQKKANRRRSLALPTWRELAAHDVVQLDRQPTDDAAEESEEYMQMVISVVGDGNASSSYVPYSDGVGTGFRLELVQDDVPQSARVMFGAMIADMHRASRSIAPGLFNGMHAPAIAAGDLDILNRNLNSVRRWWPHAFHVVTDADKPVLDDMDDDLRRNDDAIGLATGLASFVTNLRCQLSYYANPLRTSVPLPSYILMQRNRMLVLYAIMGACEHMRGAAAGRPSVGTIAGARGQQVPLINVAVTTLAALLRMPMCETPALMPPAVAESIIDALKQAVAKSSLLAFSRTSPESRDANSEALLRSACAWLRRFLAPSAAQPASVRSKALDALLLIAMRSATLNDYVAMIYYLLMPAEAARFIDVGAAAADFGAPLPESALQQASDAGFAGLPRDEQLFPLSADVTVQLSAFVYFYPNGRASGKIPPVVLSTANFPAPRAPVLEATRTMACDGATLFVHDHHGLRQVGTGYCGTERGKVYARAPDFFPDEKVYLALAHQLLFCATATEPNSVLVLSPSTLQVLNRDHPLQLPLSERAKSASSGESALLYSHLVSDSRELFAVRFNRETSQMFVDQFCTLAVVAAYAQERTAVDDGDDDAAAAAAAAEAAAAAAAAEARLVLTKSIVVQRSTKISDSDFEDLGRTRFVHAQFVVDHDRLVAVVPNPDASALITTSHRWELGGGAWVAATESENDRDLYTIALDHHNSLLWTYLPLGDFLAGYAWWMVRKHAVSPYAQAELSTPFVTVQGEVDAEGAALEYDFVSSCQHVSYEQLIASNTELSIGFAGGVGAAVAPTPSDGALPPAVTPMARDSASAPVPRTLRCHLFTGDATLQRIERNSAAAIAALAAGARCEHCRDAVLLPIDAPLRAPPATDVDERGLAPDGVKREPQKPADFFWQEVRAEGDDAAAAAAPLRAVCDLCVMNVKPIKHSAHEHPLVALLPTGRLRRGYTYGWVCDLCRQSFLAHDADVMHHCADGCSFDLCSRCFWGDRATRAQAALALCHIAADQSIDVRARLAELRPALHEFDARPPKRSAVEPTNVVIAQLADLLERTLTRYHASAAASRSTFTVSAAHRELQFHLFVVKSVVQLIKVNLYELTHCQVGSLDDGLRRRVVSLLVGRMLKPLIDGDLVVAPLLATFAFDVLEVLLLGFRTLYPTPAEQIDAVALLVTLADAPYFNPFAIGECAAMRAPRGPRWLRARDTLQPRPRNQWVLRMLADMLNNVDISSWFTTARPKADKSDKAAAASTSAAAAAPATPTNETSTADIGNNNEDEGHNDDDGNNAAAAAAAAAAATTSPDGEESFLGEGGKAASTTSSESDDVPPEPLRANLRALITDLLTGHPGEVPMLPERSYVAFAIQKQFAAAAMYGNVRPFETALCDYADIMLAAAHAALSSEGIDFSGENMRHNPLAHVTVSSLLPHFIASLGTLVVSMTTPSAQAIAVKMRQLYTGISLGLTANPNMHEKYSSYALARVAHGTPNFKWLRHGISVIGTHERVIVPHVTPRLLDLYEGAMWVAARVYTQLVIGENRTPAELTSAATLTLELFANALDKSTRAVLQNLRNGELSGPRDSVDAEQEFLLRLAGLNRRPRGTHLLFAAVRAATAPPRTRAQLMAALSVAVASDTDDDEAAPDAGAIHPLDRIERGVVAVLLKHLALTTLAMQHAAALRASKGDAKGADFSALADVWQQAQRFKVWVMQQSQALASSSSDGGASSDGETGSASGGGAESTSESTTTAATATAATTSATTSATASATTAPTTTAADPVRAFLDTIIGRIALLLHLRPMAVSNAEPVVDATTAPTAATKRWRGAVSKLTGRSRLVASALPRLTSDGGDDADDDDTLDASTDEVAATPSAAATTDQAASRWNVFFGVWKKRRRLQRSPALSEKLTSEAITFLKDAPPLDILYSAIERRVERAEQREQGLRGFADLFRSSQLDGAMIQVIPCVINAFRGDAILTQTDYTTFRVLGGLDGCGSELTRPVSAAFHDLLRLMVEYGQRRLPDVLVKAVIDAFNLTVTPFDEDALVDMGLVPWLLQLARTSRSNDSVGGCAWKLLRILIHESARNGTPKVVAVAGAAGEDEDVPVQVRGACALAASAISRLLDELTESVQAIRPLKVGSAEWTARDEPISQELLVLCSCRTPGMLPLLARPRTVHVLFDAVRFGALRTKLIALRLLREVLPLTSPGALAAYEAKRLAAAAASGQAEVWSGDDDAPADEMRLLQLGVVGALLEVIGITFEASSMHCAQAIRRLVRVASAHDVFAVANAAVAVVRALVSAPLWSERMRGVLMGALASVPQLLARTGADGAAGGIGGGALALRASMTTLTDDHESVWAAVAALYVLGGARESLRLGGRVLVVPNERADRLVYHSMLHGSVTQLRDADAHVAIEDSLIDMLRIRIAYLVPLPEVLLPASLLPTVQAVMPLLSTFVGSRAVASPRGPLRTLYYQFRTAALRMLLTLCVARPEAVIDSGLLTSVAQLAINGVAERVRYRDAEAGDGGAAAAANEQTIDASVEQLQELAQSLYELLLSDKEMAIVTLRTESHQSNMAEQRKKLVMSLVPAHKLEELMRAFSVVDLNGDGELTINEIISAQNLYSGPNPARDAELRVLYERIDTENKGSIDFFQFVIMTEGLEGYAFDADDEARDEGATRKPQLMVNAPVSVAGSNDARMSKSGQQLSGDVRGPLQAYANGGDLSGALVLIEAMAEDAAPLAERVSDAVGRGAKAVLIAVERLDAINVDDDEALPFIKSTPVPVAFVATATSQRILSALDGGYSEPERDALRESTSLHDLAAVESAQTVAALRILGVADQFDEADVAELVQEFGSVTGAIGALLSRRSRQGLLQSTSFDDFQQGALAFAKRSLSTSQLAHSAANDDDAAADEDSGDESDGGCFACGAPDHIARECPQVIGEEAAAMAAAARLRAQHGARGSDDGDAADADDAANKSTAAASKGEPSYLSTFMRSDDARSTESVHKLFVDVSKVRSSVVRVERDLATHHALQAVLALLARWPAKAERSLLALGLSATQFVALLRAATDLAAAAPPALRDSLLHGSSSQLQGAEAGAQSSTAADDVAHIAMHHLPIGAIAPFVLDVLRREPQALSTTLNEIAGTLALEAKLAEGASDGADEAAARVRRELAAHSNIEFALSMLDLLSADPSLDTSPLLHIGTLDALLRCVRFSAPQHRVHAANALLRVVRQLRDAGNSKLPAAALRDHIRILHSMLQESHANDMRDSEIVLSVMSMRYAALISEFEMLAAPLEATQALFDTKVAARAGSHEDDPTDIFGMEELERDSCSIENSLECEIVRQSFPSVGSKRWVTSGKWMYEVQVGSECAQIGWANEKFRSNIARGEGVGDDAESWAYDGLRQRKWHRGWGAYGDRWKEGDIVSCYLDLDEGTMSFSLNGKSMGVAYNGIKVEGRGLRAAASFDKKLIFNLGHSPFESPQSGFQPIDDMDSLYRADLEAFRRLYYVTELFNKRDAAERVASAATSKKSPSSDHVLQATPAATLLMNADSPTVLAASSSSAVVATSSASADEEAKSPFAPICAAALAAAAAAESTCNFDIATTATVNGVAYASLTDPAAPSAGAPILYENCAVVLRDKAGLAFSPRSLYIEAQRRRFTTQCPLRIGLVFVLSEELTDEQVNERLRRFDSVDQATARRLAASAGTDESEPIAAFEIDDSVSTTVEFSGRTRVGRCVVLKLLNGGRSTHRVDMSLVRVRGTPGPFAKSQRWPAPRESALPSDYRPINSLWTRAHDVALVRYLVDLAEHHKLESPVNVTQGMVLCALPTADRHPLLAAVDSNSLLARMHLMSYVNVQIYRALSWIDLSPGDESRAVLRDATSNVSVVGVAPTARSGTAGASDNVPSADANAFGDMFRSVRALMYPTTKARLLNSVLDSSAEGAQEEKPDVVLNRVMARRAKDATDQHAARRTLLGQTYRQLTAAPRGVFLSRQQGWRVFFAGEGGQDVGGLFREQLDEVCRELQSNSVLQLFVQSANGQHSVGDGRETWLPRASATSPLQLDLFEIVGRLIGVAVRTKNNLSVDFSSILYKFLVGERTNLRDLRGVDAMTVQSLEALRTINEHGVTDDSFGDVFTETFTTNASDGGEVELVPGGKSLHVTAANRLQFAALVERFRLRESWQQLMAIRSGLGFVIPLSVLSMYTWRELKLLVEGRATIDIELLKQHTVFRNGFSARHRVIQLFWRALESFSDAERQMFLRFAWGRSRLPPPAQLAQSPLKIALLDTPRPDDTLPQAHTCFFAIDLPAYTTLEACRSKLLYACTNAVAYDSDFNVQNADNWS